jgi:hypothetical protein
MNVYQRLELATPKHMTAQHRTCKARQDTVSRLPPTCAVAEHPAARNATSAKTLIMHPIAQTPYSRHTLLPHVTCTHASAQRSVLHPRQETGDEVSALCSDPSAQSKRSNNCKWTRCLCSPSPLPTLTYLNSALCSKPSSTTASRKQRQIDTAVVQLYKYHT